MEAVSWARRNITHDVETSTTYTSRTQIASEGEGGAEGRVEDREVRLEVIVEPKQHRRDKLQPPYDVNLFMKIAPTADHERVVRGHARLDDAHVSLHRKVTGGIDEKVDRNLRRERYVQEIDIWTWMSYGGPRRRTTD